MADDPNTPDDPATGDPDPGDPDQLGEAGKKALDAERKRARDEKKRADELEARIREIEDRDKSEGERLTEKLTAAEQRAQDAEQRAMRLEVAAAKGLTSAQAKRLVGSTVEELEADADEILDAFKPADAERPPGRPAENLRPGSVPDAEPSEDIRKIVDSIDRGL